MAWNSTEAYAKQLVKFLPKKSTILDVGCGSGRVGSFLQKLSNSKVVGLDIQDLRLPDSDIHTNIIYDGKTFPFDTNSYQCVLLSLILHHAHNYKQVLSESIRVSRSSLIVVEECPSTALGRFWMVIYDRIINFFIYRSFISTPQFKTTQDWIQTINEDKKVLSIRTFTIPKSTIFGIPRTIFEVNLR